MFSKRTRSLDNLNHTLQIKSESILIFFRVALKFEKKHDLIIKPIWDRNKLAVARSRFALNMYLLVEIRR